MVKRILFSILIVLLIATVAAGVISYGRGYRFNFAQKSLNTTGILSVSSYPNGASIWIDGKLRSATNASISLTPGWYQVRVTKEGYQPWEKQIRLQGEVVSQADALLIPTNPSLRVLTATGILIPTLSPSGAKVAYIIPPDETTLAGTLPSKTGVWVVDLRSGPLGGRSDPRQVFETKIAYDWNRAKIQWSPDEKQIILTFSKKEGTQEIISSALLFSSEINNTVATEISRSYLSIFRNWDDEIFEKEAVRIANLPTSIAQHLISSATDIRFSPDETKILYLATQSAQLTPIITPPLIGSNPTDEVRNIEANKYYVYVTKEDKNYFIADSKPDSDGQVLHWYADSKHIVFVEKDTISIIDYDSTNKRAVYTGPFESQIVFPPPSTGKLVILTNLNKPQGLPNLYEIDLR